MYAPNAPCFCACSYARPMHFLCPHACPMLAPLRIPCMLLAQVVTALVEQGKATVGLKDGWGRAAIDEARHAGALFVVAYLTGKA